MSVSCECYVFSGRRICVRLSIVQRNPTECGVSECDSEASAMRRSWLNGGLES